MAHTVVGDRIARRYRLVRFVAQGGMGEVWEALDETLGQRVALKMIRRDLLSRPVVMERLKRETSLARRVTHPNVCRLYDIGEHEDARTGERVTFLTMELLDGPTLEETIRRRGRLSPEEALPLAVQMAEGLAAAHEAGVVHRDLKSANVLLVPTSDGSRAVITDFGLARSSLEDGTSLGLTSADATVGTPAYMSPEQAEGLPAGPRADVYSLGVVLYEMVTGRWPHSGPTPMSTLLKRLREPPPSPRDVVPDLDPRWEAVILRCLAVSPQDRFASAREVALSLTSPDGPTPLSTPSPVRVPSPAVTPTIRLGKPWRRRRLLVGIGAALVPALVAGLLWRARQRGTAGEAGAPGSRRTVAVLGFKNLSQRPEAAWLSTAIAEMLTAELSAGGGLRTVPGESVARARRDLSLPETDSFAPDTLARIRSLLGTDVVVAGSYLALPGPSGDQLRLVVSVQDARGGAAPEAVTQTGTVADVLTLVSRAGARVRTSLGASGPTPAEAGEMRAAFTKDPAALRLYAEGLSALRDLDLGRARDTLLEAANADPENPLIHAALAQAWAALGYDGRAVAAAKNALSLSGGLSREDRLFVEARAAEYSHDWEKAIESYRTLFGFFPDNLEYGLRLAEAQIATRRSAEALKTCATLRRMPPPASADLRIDLAEAGAHLGLSEYEAARAAAARAAEAGAGHGARTLTALGRSLECSALTRLGRGREARAACGEARSLFAAAKDPGAEARMLNRLGAIEFEEGSYARARELFSSALAILRRIGHVPGTASALNNVADTYQMEGDLAAARPLFEEALGLYREVGDPAHEAVGLVNLAAVAFQSGDPAEGIGLARKALTVAEPTGMLYPTYLARFVLGEADLARGDPARAAVEYEAALSAARASGDQRLVAYSLAGLGDTLVLRDRLDEARSRYREALSIRTSIGNRTEEAESRLAEGLLELAAGRDETALAALESAAALFAERHVTSREARARAAEAAALAETGRADEATRALAAATALLAKSQHVPLRLSATADAARAAARLGRAAEARRLLEPALAEAGRRRLAPAEADLLVALAESLRLAGDRAAASETLTRADRAAAALPLLARLAREEREKIR